MINIFKSKWIMFFALDINILILKSFKNNHNNEILLYIKLYKINI